MSYFLLGGGGGGEFFRNITICFVNQNISIVCNMSSLQLSNLVKLLLLLLQIGHVLPLVVQIHQDVLELLLEPVLGLLQLVVGGRLLLKLRVGRLQIPLETLLAFLQQLDVTRHLLQLLLEI